MPIRTGCDIYDYNCSVYTGLWVDYYICTRFFLCSVPQLQVSGRGGVKGKTFKDTSSSIRVNLVSSRGEKKGLPRVCSATDLQYPWNIYFQMI